MTTIGVIVFVGALLWLVGGAIGLVIVVVAGVAALIWFFVRNSRPADKPKGGASDRAKGEGSGGVLGKASEVSGAAAGETTGAGPGGEPAVASKRSRHYPRTGSCRFGLGADWPYELVDVRGADWPCDALALVNPWGETPDGLVEAWGIDIASGEIGPDCPVTCGYHRVTCEQVAAMPLLEEGEECMAAVKLAVMHEACDRGVFD